MASATEKMKFPPQIKYILGNEAAERYSFYGMRAILTMFMIRVLLMKEGQAVGIYHTFGSLCYLTPLLGAFLSDRFWGKYKTIMSLSIVYCLGHLVLATVESRNGLYGGLFLIALGSGGIKPCVGAHVGDQFKAGQERMLEKVFSLFYWMINFGSTLSIIITPWTNDVFGPRIAFGIPGILMAIATVVFWMGCKHYVHVPPQGYNPHSFTKILGSGLKGLFTGKGFRANALANHSEKDVDGTQSVLKLMLLYVWVSVFWSLFDQGGSTWILQGEKMNAMIFGFNVSAERIQAANPILVMILIPIFSFGIYPLIEKLGLKTTPVRRMVAGMFLAVVSFAAVAVIQQWIENSTVPVSIAWQFAPYILITMAEVMISITGLEFAYTQAPRSMKSTVMSFWLLTVTIGNLITVLLTYLNTHETASSGYFWQFTYLMAGVAVVFALFGKFYKQQSYMEADVPPPVDAH